MNISNPATGAQKLIDVEDEKKLRTFMDKRMSQEVDAGCLGDEWKVNYFPELEKNTYSLNAFLFLAENFFLAKYWSNLYES